MECLLILSVKIVLLFYGSANGSDGIGVHVPELSQHTSLHLQSIISYICVSNLVHVVLNGIGLELVYNYPISSSIAEISQVKVQHQHIAFRPLCVSWQCSSHFSVTVLNLSLLPSEAFLHLPIQAKKTSLCHSLCPFLLLLRTE